MAAMTTALILGAAVWPNGPSPTLTRRTLHAASLYHSGRVTRLIPCGGLGRFPPTEAAAMRRVLMDAGVPGTAITLEDRSTNTRQNLAFAKPLFSGPAIVVTDHYHAPRARLIARQLGIDATTSCPPWRGANLRQQARSTLREVPAYLAALLRYGKT